MTQIVLHHRNISYPQMVFNFIKTNHYFNLFFLPEKLDFKCQHHKNYCLGGCHLTLDLDIYIACVQKLSISKMSHWKKEFLDRMVFVVCLSLNLMSISSNKSSIETLCHNAMQPSNIWQSQPHQITFCQHYVIVDARIISHF